MIRVCPPRVLYVPSSYFFGEMIFYLSQQQQQQEQPVHIYTLQQRVQFEKRATHYYRGSGGDEKKSPRVSRRRVPL